MPASKTIKCYGCGNVYPAIVTHCVLCDRGLPVTLIGPVKPVNFAVLPPAPISQQAPTESDSTFWWHVVGILFPLLNILLH